MDAFWAIFSYAVTNVTDNAVVGAEHNSSCHPWQSKVLASGKFYDPVCFIGAATALGTLVGVVALGRWLGVSALGPFRVVSAMERYLVGVTLRVCSGFDVR